MSSLFWACGGSSAGTFDPGADAGAPDGATSDPPTGDGGTTPTADGGDDAGPPKDGRIDPISVGHAWTYNVTVLGFFPLCENGVFTSNTLETSTLDGETALHVQSLCPGIGVVKYAVDGDRVRSHVGGEWILSLDAPVVAGHEWSDGYRDYTWESKGAITVPAGTFADCWQATTIASFESYILLCRGVGPVKWHFEDGLGNGYEAVLTAKNF